MSVPSPPSIVSLEAKLENVVTWIISLPAPVEILSTPATPNTVSAPAPVTIVLAPVLPYTVSAPDPVVIATVARPRLHP